MVSEMKTFIKTWKLGLLVVALIMSLPLAFAINSMYGTALIGNVAAAATGTAAWFLTVTAKTESHN